MAKKAVASRMDDLFNDMMLVDSGDLIAGVSRGRLRRSRDFESR